MSSDSRSFLDKTEAKRSKTTPVPLRGPVGGGADVAMAMVVALLVVVGCGGRVTGGGGMATYAAEGVTFQLPPGWVKGDNLHYQAGHGDDHLGTVMVLPLAGQTLDAYVDTASRQSGNVAGRRSLEVDGHKAVELLLDSENKVCELYIQRVDEVVYLSFSTPPGVFDGQLAAFRAAGKSVRFQ